MANVKENEPSPTNASSQDAPSSAVDAAEQNVASKETSPLSADAHFRGDVSMTDNDIIRRVQAGERELFGELHARHHDRVYRHISRSIFSPESAQDVAGEVWLRAYRAVDRFEPREEWSTVAWLLRIAANAVTDYRRRLPPECHLEIEGEGGVLLHLVSPSAEREAQGRERLQDVRRALQTLSLADRQIIALAHGEDLSCAQIAQVLGKPSISAVTSHLHRAMTHLRSALRDLGWNEGGQETGRARRRA